MKKWFVRLILIVLGVLISLVIFVAGAFLIANRTNGTLTSSGEKRNYLLYVPESYDPSVPTPLVISMHGFAGWPANQMGMSRWNDLADEYGFIVVYPSGTRFPLRWRTNSTSGSDADLMLDVTFISDLIDKLSAEYNIDPTRIYANGLSNGGGMSFVLSCKLSERIAAIGTVSGAYPLPWEECNSSRSVPAIVFHGTEDPIVPYQGGPSGPFDTPLPAITEWVDAFARHNGCDEAPQELAISGAVSGVQFTNCDGDVVFYTIEGGGHSWPGGAPLPEIIVGNTSNDIDATRTMWDFFQQHPLSEDGD